MKLKISLFAIFTLIFASGCRTHVDGGYDYGHHGSVSVGVHGNADGAAVVGALIVGGIIGSMITESEQKKKQQAEAAALQQQNERQQNEGQQNQQPVSVANLERELAKAKQASASPLPPAKESLTQNTQNSRIELADNSTEIENYQRQLAEKPKAIQWYQVGKDERCYLMSVDNGVTDIVQSVDLKNCN
ncbi:MAG: hypothetical protein Q9M92_03620 [Enterobacterales bacterium]|nr:hypothetical protein [Enterobacterales bacterium]